MNRKVGLVTPCEPRTAFPKLCSRPAGTAGATPGSWAQSALIPLEWRLPMNQPTPAPLPGGELKSPPATKLPSSEGLRVGSWAHSGFSKTSELPMNLVGRHSVAP